MATVKISNLPPAPPGTGTGSSQGTDLFPATDTTDTTSAASGTTKKYTLSEIYNWMLQAQGLTVYAAVRVATTLALTVVYDNGTAGVGATLTNAGAQVALEVDGVTMAVGNRVLVWQQTGPTQNGIYVVTNIGSDSSNWVMTRATDYDQPSEIVQYGIMLVNQGATYAGRLFQETGAGPFTIGSTPITFALYTAGTLQVPVLLSQGGTSASLTASNGGIFYSTASAGAILAGTVTARQILQSGAGAAPSWSTTTYPATNAINTIMYASSANVLGVIAPANSAALVSNGSGVPGWVAYTGAGAPVLGTGPTISVPLIDQINDTNDNPILELLAAATAVNYFRIDNAASGAAPALQPVGADTNIGITIVTKGTSPIGFQSEGLTNQYSFYTGTGFQHITNFNFPATAANRTVTWPDADGTVAFTSSSSGIVNSGTANQLAYYATTGTAVSGLTSAASGVLVTSAGSVPSISSTLPAGLTIPTPKIAQINDTNGNAALTLPATASAVNYLQITNNSTTNPVGISVAGSDTNIGMTFTTQGTGAYVYNTTATSAQITLNSGGSHISIFTYPATAATQTYTWPDATGTLLITGQAISTVPSINFGGSTLSNYVEATFTPTIVSSGGGSATYTLQQGAYTRIGNRVFVNIYVILASNSLSAGDLSVATLPIAAAGTCSLSFYATTLAATAITTIMATTANASTSISLYKFSSGAASTLTAADSAATSQFVITGSYIV